MMNLPGSGGRRPIEPPKRPEVDTADKKTCQCCGKDFWENELDAHREEVGNGQVIVNIWCPNCGELVDEILQAEPQGYVPEEHQAGTDMVM